MIEKIFHTDTVAIYLMIADGILTIMEHFLVLVLYLASLMGLDKLIKFGNNYTKIICNKTL